MTDVCKVLRRQRSFGSHGGVGNDAVSAAEARLGTRFAKDYRAYLMELGAARFYGHEMTGLNCPSHVDVVEVTLEDRELMQKVPTDLYVIEEAGVDGIVYWQGPSGEVYETRPNSRPVKRFASLAQYVEAMGGAS